MKHIHQAQSAYHDGRWVAETPAGTVNIHREYRLASDGKARIGKYWCAIPRACGRPGVHCILKARTLKQLDLAVLALHG